MDVLQTNYIFTLASFIDQIYSSIHSKEEEEEEELAKHVHPM